MKLLIDDAAATQSEERNEKCHAAIEVCGMNVELRYISLLALSLQTTAAVIITRYSKSRGSSSAEYSNASVVVSQELVKMIASLVLMFICDTADTTDATESNINAASIRRRLNQLLGQLYDQNIAVWSETLKLAIPALLYTTQNNLLYVALSNLEATTFQVGYQSKVVTTAILSVAMLPNRSLTKLQWFAIVMLMIGIVMTQSNTRTHVEVGEMNTTLGLVAVLTSSTCSSLAGVYFEKILKGTKPSLWMRNMQLATFCFVIALSTYCYTEGLNENFFGGYDLVVTVMILNQALGGLIIAMVIKHADNVVKGFATAASIILCGTISVFFFGFSPSTHFVIGCLIAIAATIVYSW